MKNLYKIKNDLYVISNTEQIKLNDYITDGFIVFKRKDDSSLLGRKKVILTTDQDLIKDGVQAIDDEFLEWFVKNSSCTEVNFEYLIDETNGELMPYKIIIPEEEPKQELERGITITHVGKPKQETLEEVAKNYAIDNSLIGYESMPYKGFINGAKWQQEQNDLRLKHSEALLSNCEKTLEKKIKQERSYSEEDMVKAICMKKDGVSVDSIMKQFKKKIR